MSGIFSASDYPGCWIACDSCNAPVPNPPFKTGTLDDLWQYAKTQGWSGIPAPAEVWDEAVGFTMRNYFGKYEDSIKPVLCSACRALSANATSRPAETAVESANA